MLSVTCYKALQVHNISAHFVHKDLEGFPVAQH